LAQYNRWRDGVSLLDDASKRSLTTFGRYITTLVGHGFTKSNAHAGTMYTIDKVVLTQHLRGMGFGTSIDIHSFE
jgi:hypothetical protein